MKIWKLIIAYVIAFVIQGSLLNIAAVSGQTPNLLLALTIAIAYLHEEKPYALIFGAIFGLLSDFCFSTAIGPTAIMLVIVSALIYVVDMVAPKENGVYFIVTAALATVLFYMGSWLLIKIQGNPAGLIVVLKQLPIKLVLTMAVALIVYVILLARLIKKTKKKNYV